MSRWQNIKALAGTAGIYGWLLLAYPVLDLLTTRQRSVNAYAQVDSSAVVMILYTILCFVAIISSGKNHHAFSLNAFFNTPMVWFLLYTIYAFFSMAWSVDFKLSGYRAFECLVMLLLMATVWQRLFATHNMNIVIDWCMLWVGLQIICQLLNYLRYTTNLADLIEGAQMVSTTFFFMALYRRHKRWIHYLIIVLSVLSGSTVGYIGMCVGLVSLFFGESKDKFPIFLLSMLLMLFIVFYGPQRFIKDTIFYDKPEISIEATTGRNHIMEAGIRTIKEQPLGYGFFVGEVYALHKNGIYVINGHNSFFSAAMGLGYVGIVSLFIFFLGMFRVTFFRGIPRQYRQPLIGCFFVGFFHCMGNPGIGSRIYGSWMPVMLLFTLICSFYAYNRKYLNAHNVGY